MRRTNPAAIASVSARLAAIAFLLVLAVSAPSVGWAADPWRHDTPPPVGTLLEVQSGLFRCASVAGARYSAETGFLAVDCRPLERAGVWRVVACREDAVSHGSLRLLEVLAADGRRSWIPLPWHDWA